VFRQPAKSVAYVSPDAKAYSLEVRLAARENGRRTGVPTSAVCRLAVTETPYWKYRQARTSIAAARDGFLENESANWLTRTYIWIPARQTRTGVDLLLGRKLASIPLVDSQKFVEQHQDSAPGALALLGAGVRILCVPDGNARFLFSGDQPRPAGSEVEDPQRGRAENAGKRPRRRTNKRQKQQAAKKTRDSFSDGAKKSLNQGLAAGAL